MGIRGGAPAGFRRGSPWRSPAKRWPWGTRAGPASGRPTLALVDEENHRSEPTCEDDPARGLHQQDLHRLLTTALDRLSPTIRATFVLFAEAGLSYKEIAEVQEIPIGTVMSRLHHARNKLQSYLNLDTMDGIES